MFTIIDHASGEAWSDATLRIDRLAAADLLREVCTERFGSVERAVASGLALRYDEVPASTQSITRPRSTTSASPARPAYHYQPKTNGCVEKLIQTLKQQPLWIERFQTHEQLHAAARGFARRYNAHWLLERHGYRTPIEARQHLPHQAALA